MGGINIIKLLLGGSPCTHWSCAQTKNRETEPSGIGWELFKNYVIAKEKYKPDYFLYENNKSMAPAIREQITKELGVEPILINSTLVSAQNRQRLYWTNIPNIQQPEDKCILLRDVLERITDQKSYELSQPKILSEKEMDYMVRETKDGRNHFDFEYFHDGNKPKSSCVTANTHKGVPYNVLAEPVRIGTIENEAKRQDFDSQQYRVYSPDGKSVTICGQGGGVGAKTGLYAAPIEEANYEIINGADVLIANGKIRQGDEKGSKQGKYVYTELTEKSNTISAGQAHNEKVLCKKPDGGNYRTVYEVKDGQITIKDKQYPIKLADGFYIIRKLTVRECMRLQTVPEDYIFPVSDTQSYKMLGNGWTCDVISHILSFCPSITTEPLEVLSMYDGMSCGRIALNKLGVNVTKYYATEIDKYAIKTTMTNFPDTIQLGDAFQVRDDGWSL